MDLGVRASIAITVSFIQSSLFAQETTATPAPTRPWSLLVYCAIDNNADGPCQEFLATVRRAIDDDPSLDVVVLLDRSEEYSDEKTLVGEDFTGCRLYRLTRDSAQRLAGGEHLPELTLDADPELNSADPKLLRRFVAFGKQFAPAQRTALLIYSHANGENMCPDEHAVSEMFIPELADCDAPKVHVDLLALELCNMAGLEIAYEWSPRRPGGSGFTADWLVAIPNAGPPLDWDRAFARMRTPGHESGTDQPALDLTLLSPEDFGRLVVAEGQAGRIAATKNGRPMTHEAAGVFDLHAAVAAKACLDKLARTIGKSDEAKQVLIELRGPGDEAAMNYSEGGPYVDAFDLCRDVVLAESLPDETRQAAKSAMAAIDRFVSLSFGMDAYEGFESGKHGVFLVFPQPGQWRRFEWYTPFQGAGRAYGRWAFLKDGLTPNDGKIDTWFELLDHWFDDNENGDGGLNEYEP